MTIRFRFISSFLNSEHYEVLGDGAPYRIETRRPIKDGLEDYQRSIFNGTEAEWQRDVIGASNLVYRATEPGKPLPQTVIDAFNSWRAAEHAQQVAAIRAHPAGYGDLEADDPILIPPSTVLGCRYVVGDGWLIDPAAQRPPAEHSQYKEPSP
jgi:hypothetical protein